VKACPQCYRLYPDDGGFCPIDGGPLKAYAEVSAEPAGDDHFLGKTIANRYEMRRIVADGGMGRVYEARDAQTDRRVAVKVLHPEVARDPVAVERFRREYEISKDLPHDHIVEVLDFQQIDASKYFMVMEFLDGEELRTVLKRDKTVEPARLVRVLSQIAVGLDEAHRRQFVHRDLKPDNVFLCGSHDGYVVKLLDFGSVRINKNRQQSKLTSLGTTIGSPFYMSPEQAQGAENLDNRADVFALGAIVYECLAGIVPFTGANGPAILLAILTKQPAPVSTKANPEWRLPTAIDDVIDDALAKKPEMRTPTVGALADAFGKAFGLSGTHVEWAQTPTTVLKQKLEEAKASGAAGAVPVGDPFASDPFAMGVGAAPAPPPPPPPAQMAPREAMDQAFAAAGAGSFEPVGVPQRSMGIIVIAIVIALAVVGGIVFFLVRS